LFQCLIKQYKMVAGGEGSRGIGPPILNFDTRYTWLFYPTPWPLYVWERWNLCEISDKCKLWRYV